MAKLRTHHGGGFTVTLADGTVLNRNWPQVTGAAQAADQCRQFASVRRTQAARLLADAAVWDRAADELDPPALPLEPPAALHRDDCGCCRAKLCDTHRAALAARLQGAS